MAFHIPSATQKAWKRAINAVGDAENAAIKTSGHLVRRTRQKDHVVVDPQTDRMFYTCYNEKDKKCLAARLQRQRGGQQTPNLERIVAEKDVHIKIVNPKSRFAVVTYWWGRGNVNSNLQRPCPEDLKLQPGLSVKRPGKTYDAMIEEWKLACERHNCNYICTEFPEFAVRGMYQTAINAKPLFIRKALEVAARSGLDGVVYIDGDMNFREYPDIFDMEDVDYMARGWNIDPRASEAYLAGEVCFDPFVFETSGGIMYFGNTTNARLLLDLWARASTRAVNVGKADDRIISVIISSLGLLITMNIIQLPIEYLWLNDMYDAELGGHVQNKDVGRIICEHPHCLTGEERAKDQGAAANRNHLLYRNAVERHILCTRGGGLFYEYVFFDAANHGLSTYAVYNNYMDETKMDDGEPCYYTIYHKNRYGAKLNPFVDARLKRAGIPLEAALSIGVSTTRELVPSSAHSFTYVYENDFMEILRSLMSGQAVVYLPNTYLGLIARRAAITAAAHRRGATQVNASMAVSTALRKLSTRRTQKGGEKVHHIAPLTTKEKKATSVMKMFLAKLKKMPHAEFIACIQESDNPIEEGSIPRFAPDTPMYFSPNSRTLRHLLVMSDMTTLQKVFVSSFVFVTRIRCAWVIV